MARPIKEGLSYFPLDVDSDYDDKLQLIESLYGPTGFASVIKIFMKIYSVGYYYKWEEKEELLMAKRIGIDSNSLKNIINDCVKYDLFDEELFKQFNILTSEGIQKRFFTAVGKRKVGVVIEEYLLIEKEEVTSLCPKMTFKRVIQGKTQVNQGNTEVNQESSTQSKVKESKVNKTKVNKSNDEEKGAAPSNDYSNELDPHFFYQNNFRVAESPFVSQCIEMWIEDLSAELVLEAMKRAVIDQKGFKYAEGIMKKWDAKNIKTLDQVHSDDVAFENQKNRKSHSNPFPSKQPARKEKLPDWAQEGYQAPKETPVSPEVAKDIEERLERLRKLQKNQD